ncbi:MAG: HTTM domain-containing protein [Pirellulales bacterium]|nr:HTTM domain-containing protein [Pirellulales bacterium]
MWRWFLVLQARRSLQPDAAPAAFSAWHPARWRETLAAPVSGASLAVFRIGFGLVLCYEGLYYLGFIPFAPNGAVAFQHLGQWLGWSPAAPVGMNLIQALYTGPHVHWNIAFPGFAWVRPLPEPAMTLVFVGMTLAALLVALGWSYRPAVVCLFFSFAYVNLIELCVYLNHFYLACLLLFLLCWMPADRCFSVRAWLERDPTGKRPLEQQWVPFWCVFLLRAQMFILYFYAGIAKTNPDWLSGEPPRTWLHQSNAAHYLERFFGLGTMQSIRAFLAQEGVCWLMTIGGLALDLSIGFFLVWRRTRIAAFLLLMGFHGTNFCLFNIGAFPVFAILATTIFFDPDWPLRVGRWLRRPRIKHPDWPWLLAGTIVLPGFGTLAGWRLEPSPAPTTATRRLGWLGLALIGVWFAYQTIVPLRHFWIPGYVCWTEEGSLASWHMMLRHKVSGPFAMEIVDPGLEPQPGPAGPRLLLPRPASSPLPRVYRDVDADNVPWAELPEFVLTYEPLVGERILYNPLSSAARGTATPAQVQEYWQRTSGRTAQVTETFPFATLLRTHKTGLKSRLQSGTATGASRQATLRALLNLNVLEQLVARAEKLESGSTEHEEIVQDIQRHLQLQIEAEQDDVAFASLLAKLAPFSLQGARNERSPWLAIYDAGMLVTPPKQGNVLFTLARERWQGYEAILIDVERLTDLHMLALPPVITLVDFHGRPALFWNQARDLHALQSVCVRTNPPALHRYVQRVAAIWEAQYGRRPQIHVTSWVKLNARAMAPLVDPQVDLAAAPLHIFRHNDWIEPPAPLPGQAAPADNRSAPGAIRGLWTQWAPR